MKYGTYALTLQRKMLPLSKRYMKCVISGFRREVPENCAVLGYYAASSDNFLATFRDNVSVPSSGSRILEPEDGTDKLSRNVAKKLSLLAA